MVEDVETGSRGVHSSPARSKESSVIESPTPLDGPAKRRRRTLYGPPREVFRVRIVSSISDFWFRGGPKRNGLFSFGSHLRVGMGTE
jgi:hypothetical protein